MCVCVVVLSMPSVSLCRLRFGVKILIVFDVRLFENETKKRGEKEREKETEREREERERKEI